MFKDVHSNIKLNVKQLGQLKQCLFIRAQLNNLPLYAQRPKLMLEMNGELKTSKTAQTPIIKSRQQNVA